MVLRKERKIERRRAGFTLMEMLVVVAIIVALAGLGGYYFLGQANQARKSSAKAQIQTLTQAAETYKLDHLDQWPPSLESLLNKDEYGGPYLKNSDALIDPWGKRYSYQQPGQDQMYPPISCVAPDGTQISNGPSKGLPH